MNLKVRWQTPSTMSEWKNREEPRPMRTHTGTCHQFLTVPQKLRADLVVQAVYGMCTEDGDDTFQMIDHTELRYLG